MLREGSATFSVNRPASTSGATGLSSRPSTPWRACTAAANRLQPDTRHIARLAACSALWALLAAAAWVAPPLLLRHYFTVTSTDDTYYASWAAGGDADHLSWANFTVWNLTNAFEVVDNGATPVYAELGPYVYRLNRTKVGVSFRADRKFVSYREQSVATFQHALSAGSDQSIVTTVNDAYMYVTARAGGEARLQAILVAPSILSHLSFFEHRLYPALVANHTAIPLAAVVAQLVQGVGEQSFYSTWASATSVPPDGNPMWRNMLVAAVSGNEDWPLGEPHGDSTELPWPTVQRIFDPTWPGSVLDARWAAARAWAAAASTTVVDGGAEEQDLARNLSLSTSQVRDIARWRAQFASSNGIDAALLASWGVQSPWEMALLQWSSAGPIPTRGVSVADLFPGKFPTSSSFNPAWPEYGYFIGHYIVEPMPRANITAYLAGQLLNVSNPMSLVRIQGIQAFFELVQNSSMARIFEQWGLNNDQTEAFNTYCLRTEDASYVRPLLATYKNALVASRAVSAHIWDNHDSLVEYMSPPGAPQFIKRWVRVANGSESSTVRERTGYVDPASAHTLAEFDGATRVSAWQPPEDVRGTRGAAFGFNVSRDSTLWVWDPDLGRPLALVCNDGEETTVGGVSALRFRIAPGQLTGLDPAHDITNVSMSGLQNLTALRGGMPTFASLPHFLNASASLRSRVYGVSAAGLHDYDSVVDVEPVSGQTLRMRWYRQYNMFAGNRDWFPKPTPPGCLTCHANFDPSIVHPLVWRVDGWEGSPALSVLRPALYVRTFGSLTAAAVSALLLAAAGIASCWYCRLTEKRPGLQRRVARPGTRLAARRTHEEARDKRLAAFYADHGASQHRSCAARWCNAGHYVSLGTAVFAMVHFVADFQFALVLWRTARDTEDAEVAPRLRTLGWVYSAALSSSVLVGVVGCVWYLRSTLRTVPLFRPWLSQNLSAAASVVLLSSVKVSSIKLMHCKAFGLRMLSAPRHAAYAVRMQALGTVAVLLEDVPQLIVTLLAKPVLLASDTESADELSLAAAMPLLLNAMSLLGALVKGILAALWLSHRFQERGRADGTGSNGVHQLDAARSAARFERGGRQVRSTVAATASATLRMESAASGRTASHAGTGTTTAPAAAAVLREPLLSGSSLAQHGRHDTGVTRRRASAAREASISEGAIAAFTGMQGQAEGDSAGEEVMS